MTLAIETPLMTTEQLLAMPEDGIDRELIRGELREKEMTVRNRYHSKTEARIAHILLSWLEKQPLPRGEIYSGEVGVRIRKSPASVVGIDVAYVPAEVEAVNQGFTTLVDGIPVLAVEILSPSDKQEDILEKIREYLDCGVRQVWIVEPQFRTITIYRPGAEPVLFNMLQEIDGGTDLPGFRAGVAEFLGLEFTSYYSPSASPRSASPG